MDPNGNGFTWKYITHLEDIRAHDIYTIDNERKLKFPQYSPPHTPVYLHSTSSHKRQLKMETIQGEQKRLKTQSVVESDFLENTPNNQNITPNEDIIDDDSWEDLSKHVTPPPPAEEISGMRIRCAAEECLRLLKEAQRESNSPSVCVSRSSSRVSPGSSPKSPPNSPNNEAADESDTSFEELIQIINREVDYAKLEGTTDSDWIWDWSSRPYLTPPKKFKFVHPENAAGGHGASVRKVMLGSTSLFSKDVLYTLVITNVLSLIIGAGIGLWWSKRSSGTFIIGHFPLY